MKTTKPVPPLRKMRMDRGLTLEQVGKSTGIGIPNLSDIERGNLGISKEAAEKLVAFYGRDCITEMELLYPERYFPAEAA